MTAACVDACRPDYKRDRRSVAEPELQRKDSLSTDVLEH
jgi:hypothetical protein